MARQQPERVREQVGSVYLIKTPASPNWYLEWCHEGEQYRQTTRTRSKKQALKLAKEKDAKLVLGQLDEPKRRGLTIEQAITKYIASLRSQDITAKTLDLYQRDLTQFQLFAVGQSVKRLDRVDADLLEAFVQQLRDAGAPRTSKAETKRGKHSGPNRPRTIRGKLKTVRQMIRWAVKRGLIKKDPALGYRLPRPVNTLAPHFTSKEIAHILEASEEPYRTIYEFLVLTGLRSSEMQWLTKEDLGPEAAYVRIREKTCPFTGQVWKPKHGRERTVPLPARASAIAHTAATASPGPWLFCRATPADGQPGRYDCQQLLRPLKAVLKRLKIKHGSIHTFRHSYITHLVNAGASIFEVKELVGHDKITTLEAYYHHQADRLSETIRRVDFDGLVGTSSNGDGSPVTGSNSSER
ncbi:MAG: tyrosine-type recombinase/integrase [Phycisphaeraceae bacterium]